MCNVVVLPADVTVTEIHDSPNTQTGVETEEGLDLV